jgi:predicted phosphodiesterase
LALDHVLADIALEPGINVIVAAGDLCESGPDPAGVIQTLVQHEVVCIRGNTDRDLASGLRDSRTANWTMEQLGEDGITFLRALPFDHRITPPGGRPGIDDLLVVHANPFDEDRNLPPWAAESELQAILGDTRAAVLAFGHIHISYVRALGEMTLLNVAAVGNPKDEDLRSRWGLCTWDESTGKWAVELRYVDYPLDETRTQVLASGLPSPEKLLRKLEHASYRVVG